MLMFSISIFIFFGAETHYKIYLIDSSCQLRTSLSDIFFLKRPFFCMFRLLAAKFSKSVKVPAERVEWILADTDNVEPAIFLL